MKKNLQEIENKIKDEKGFVLIQMILLLPIISLLSATLFFVIYWNEFSFSSLEYCLENVVNSNLDDRAKLNSSDFKNGVKKSDYGSILFMAKLTGTSKNSKQLYLSAKTKTKKQFFHLEEVWNCNVRSEKTGKENLTYVEAVKSWSKLWLPQL